MQLYTVNTQYHLPPKVLRPPFSTSKHAAIHTVHSLDIPLTRTIPPFIQPTWREVISHISPTPPVAIYTPHQKNMLYLTSQKPFTFYGFNNLHLTCSFIYEVVSKSFETL